MSSKRKGSRYDEEFKKRAVRLSNTSERSVKEVADSLGVQTQLLYRWRQLYTLEGEKTKLSEANDENSALRQRIAELEEENYILKKATAFFAKNQK
ncbi:MAG: transposase [Firmicutes bacterium]|nr:transposase [Bacillota bacterium]